MPIDHIDALPPGTRLEEYRLDTVLGAGGFGITYRAYDAHLDKFVAIKEYLPGEFAARTQASTVVPKSDTDARDYHWGLGRFLDEARTLARFDHPHLNKVYRFFESNGTAYMVLEYVQGETLASRLSKDARLQEAVLRRLLDEVLSGLVVVHEAGYVHRDIKPGNLMLREGDGGVVVLDFGAARQAVGQRSRPMTSILTPGYAPIEQYDSRAEDVGPWSDIYALGMVAYRCISGVGDNELPDAVTRARLQRKGQDDLAPAAEVGKGRYQPKLLEAIDWAMDVDEGERPQSVAEWQRALVGERSRKRASRTEGKQTPGSGTGATRRAGMRWLDVAFMLVIVVLLGIGAWWGWQAYPEWFGQGEEAPAQAERQEAPMEMPEAIPQGAGAGDTEAASARADAPPPESSTASASPEPAGALPEEEDEVSRLLAAAEADLTARRLTSPAGSNAWDRYRRVLELDPANAAAVKGMEMVIEGYRELFAAALGQEDFEKAAAYLAKVGELHPDSPVLEEGEWSLAAARQARADRLAQQERQRRAEAEARQAEQERQRVQAAIREHWEAFETALAAGDLDEAAAVLAGVRGLDPGDEGLATGEQRLAAAQAELEHRRRQAAEAKARQLAGEMVSIPAGSFRMGDLSGEGHDDEKPVHSVTVPAFRLGKHEVTFARWDACVADGGCNGYTPDDEGWGRGDRPVINVSWNDVQSFIGWLNRKTGGNYRLPTEAEWEYAARAGSTTEYSWGDDIGSNRANCANDYCGDSWDTTAPVGSFPANPWGLHDMHGNVWEWVQDCWNDSYEGAPTDGSAWTSGDCVPRVIRGGSWNNDPWLLHSALRDWDDRSYRNYYLGFRLAQDK